MLSAPSFRHLRYAPPASAPADIASLHFCYNALQCSKATESRRTKNARDRVWGVQMTNCFVHMIEFEQTIEFCALLCSHTHTHIYCATAHMIGGSRGRGLSWDTSDTAADTIDRQPCIARSQISMFWSDAFDSTKTVAATPWRSKTVRGKLQYSISGSLEIQGMVRGYSFDIRFTLSRNIQSGYSEDIPSMVFLPRRTCPFGA